MRQNFDTTGQNMFFQAPPSVLITTLCIDNHHCESEHVHPARGVFSCSDISIEFHDGEEDEDDDAVFLFMFQMKEFRTFFGPRTSPTNAPTAFRPPKSEFRTFSYSKHIFRPKWENHIIFPNIKFVEFRKLLPRKKQCCDDDDDPKNK